MNWLLGFTSYVIAALALIGMPEWRLPIILGGLVVSAIGVIWGWDALVARVHQRQRGSRQRRRGLDVRRCFAEHC